MDKAKKFGAFAGVFTPSILTILGVIMYMRLGWVVGQAGLINTIIIILLAHVISLSTGLSVSSIATDKKIKAGGIYYILSRSMGLPIGGAIGITLFVGTALSISLYLIGFAESVLSIDAIREFLNLEQNINGYRIIGSGAILVLVIIAFISTSLAIKTQYYILGAIVLSLVSIFVGLFINSGFTPDAVSITPARDGLPLEVIFAVFFPAVTGFTAGVAMSGDLKDPEKSIPLGTMASIAVGFVVYIVLAVAFAYMVDRNLLMNNTNFLLQIAWFAPFVIAGIWGATLSSALGGILGGPRILQAASVDRITPKFFGKGHGINNEPRNALLFIFLIAEGGILIGELNVIAGIVTMFYLASYGAINIAYFLESWASADFRPTFKINRYIGLIGFIAAFGIMFQLDMFSMLAAIIIILGIYFYLKRKQLKFDYGDVWQSVWSSLMRTALQRMDNTEDVERNWQPNIILFSGATKKRPHLLELGKNLVGRHGVLSNFDLTENKKAKVLFPKAKQSLPGEVSEKGVFTRRQTVKDIYEGIEMISRTYGFSGLEPNTIMMGWAKQTKNPHRFAELLNTLYDLDLNILLVGYDKIAGFGNYKTIDIWFRDKSNLGSLALSLSKLLLLSPQWENAKIRVLIENAHNERSESISRKAENILEQTRVDGIVKVLNNQIEKKPFYQLVEEESKNTDLVFLRIPTFKASEEEQFVEETNALLNNIGTVILISAASSFKKQKLLDDSSQEILKNELKKSGTEVSVPEINYPTKPEITAELQSWTGNLFKLHLNFFKDYYQPLFNINKEKSELIEQTFIKTFKVLEEKSATIKPAEISQLLAQLKSSVLIRITKMLEEQINLLKGEKEELLDRSFQFMIDQLSELLKDLPEFIEVKISAEDLASEKHDKFSTKFFKSYHRTFFNSKIQNGEFKYNAKFKEIISDQLRIDFYTTLTDFLKLFGRFSINFIYEYQKLMYAIGDTFVYLEKNSDADNFNQIIKDSKQSIDEHILRLKEIVSNNQNTIQNKLLENVAQTIEITINKLKSVPVDAKSTGYSNSREKEQQKTLIGLPDKWAYNQNILYRSVKLESQLLLIEFRLQKVIKGTLNEINSIIENQVFEPVNEIQKRLKDTKKGSENKNLHKGISYDVNKLKLGLNKVVDKAFKNIKTILKNLPGQFEIFTEETTNEITNIQFEKTEIFKLPVFRIIDTSVHNNMIAPLLHAVDHLVNEIHQNTVKIEDAARLMSLSDQSNGILPEDEIIFSGNMEEFISNQFAKIDLLQANNEKLQSQFEEEIYRKLKETTDEFHLYRLVKTAEQGPGFSSSQAAKRGIKALRQKIGQFGNYLQQIQANIWHSQSIASLFASDIIDVPKQQYALTDSLLKFKEDMSPNQQTLSKLPFYYQQLFINKYNYQPEFWIGREKEVASAKKTFERYRSGKKGCLIVTGEWRSGKSFFANYVSGKFAQEKPVYTIKPSATGSISVLDFEKTLQDSTQQQGRAEDIFRSVPAGSVCIMEDLELWWERADNGKELLDYILNLIKQYGEKCLFILIFNQESYHLINQLVPYEQLAINHIRLKPFNSKELQEIILFRHRTSGFELQVDKSNQTGLTLTRQARLFSRVFKSSQGNVGTALLNWISSIHDFNNNTVFIKSVQKQGIEVFDGLSKDQKVLLIQFVLHKRLTIEKISRITLEDNSQVEEQIRFLKRTGILNELAGKVYEIDKYIYLKLKNYLYSSLEQGE